MSWLDNIPLSPLIIATLRLGLAPVVPEPHLGQKLKMLAAGERAKPIDIFDLCMHAAPGVLLLIRVARQGVRK